ncbi:MAG: hypothetical protein RI565_01900 [Schleiferiaceae bacterium]|nr:hypothetical protein [Schleiferiaceae bacterium]
MKQRLTSAAVLLVLAVFFMVSGADWINRAGRATLFYADVNQYYSYLPAAFLENDLGFTYEHNYWTNEGQKGREVPKVTMGMALLYSPWFGLGYWEASREAASAGELTGYERAFEKWIHRGSLVYALVAAFLLLQCLYYFFPPIISGLSYLSLFFGSNLFYYTLSQGEMAHGYLFLLLSLLVLATIRFHQKESSVWLVLLGLSFGWAVLIRPTLLIVGLFPLLYGVYDRASWRKKWALLASLRWRWGLLLLAFLVPLLPQLFYWQWAAGDWLFYSYGSEEGFFWMDPKIGQVLFSFRKGWLMYTPLAVLMLLGMFRVCRMRTLRWAITPLLLLSVYVISSWWDWWYGGCFSHRAFVHYYPFWVFGLTASLTWAWKKWRRWIPLSVFVLLCIGLNLQQSQQYLKSMIHWDGMTREAYFFIWGRSQLSQAEYQKLDSLLQRPNYEAARSGNRDQ